MKAATATNITTRRSTQLQENRQPKLHGAAIRHSPFRPARVGDEIISTCRNLSYINQVAVTSND